MDEKSEILQVAETDAGVYFLRIDYEEGLIADALGHVFRTEGKRKEGEVPTQVLATNDTLRTLWASPQGSLWVASSKGSVGTTAKVRWPRPASGADYLTMGGSPKWSVTDLPRVKATGLIPNVTALWGTGDSDVYAGTYGGHIYRWDGSVWTESFAGPGEGRGTIRNFGGAPKNVFAVGKDATILHFDGRRWRPLEVPGPPNGSETLTGVHLLPDGDVLIAGSGDEGRLLSGSARGGLEEFGRYPIDLIDMASLDERILFCTGDGVAELVGRNVEKVKDTFQTITMSAGKGRLFFIEPAPGYPGYVEYDPRQGEDAWWGMEY
jgi:hypothetical protein